MTRGTRAARAAVSAVVLALLLAIAPSKALAFSQTYFFGDSFTDTGNNGPGAIPELAPFVASFGYDQNRWTNAGGTVWADSLATGLGTSSASSAFGGTNYAVGGDRSDEMAAQVSLYSADAGGSADPNALYTVWAGGNDMLQNNANPAYTPAWAVSNVVATINSLSVLGAQHFLVGNLPDFAPMSANSGPLGGAAPIPANVSTWTADFNARLSTALAELGGVTIYEFDAAAVLDPLLQDPVGNGFSQGLDLCCTDADCVAGIGTADFLMHDHLHATSAAHDLVGAAALAIVPEPATGLLLAAGLLGIGMRRRV